MNKAYKVIYNETTGTYVAVSELETSHGKATQSIKTSRFTKLHGLGSIKRLDFNKFTLASLGIFTAFAMPMAHASWVNDPNFASTSGNNAIAIGSSSSSKATADGNDAIAIGSGAKVTGENGVAIGSKTEADRYSYALGYEAQAIGNGASSIAIGYQAQAFSEPGGNTAIAIGSNALAKKSGIAIGSQAQAGQDSAIAIGWGANATDSKSGIAIGDRANAIGAPISRRAVAGSPSGLPVSMSGP